MRGILSKTMEKKRFKIATLGCRTNQYESEAYRNQLEKLGYIEAQDHEEADLCIVNTCTVTESADQKSRYQIKQFGKQNPDAEIFVTGCLAERAPKELLHLKGVKKVVSNLEKENLIPLALPHLEEYPEFRIEQFEAHTRAFLKVQDGCNSYCSYCVIPFVRGRSRSKTIEEAVVEAKALIASGYKEIVLTGINIGDFDGGDGTRRLVDLVDEIDNLPGLERLRISSIDPDEVDDALINAIIKGKKTCHSMHLVLQSGSNTVLKRMNRKYTKHDFFDAVERLQASCPDFTFTTDVIVGFPGESEDDFAETLAVIETVKFAKVHMFPYSVRPKTRASRFTDHLPKEVIERRKNEVLRHSERVAFALRERYVGREVEVLIESDNQGHTDNFLAVEVKGREFRSNEIVRVKCLENSPERLIGVAL